MSEVQILEEMLGIYRKYFKAVEMMGTITMSPKDKQRLDELERSLSEIRTVRQMNTDQCAESRTAK